MARIPGSSSKRVVVPESITLVNDLVDVLDSFTIGDARELRFFGVASNFGLSNNSSFSDDLSVHSHPVESPSMPASTSRVVRVAATQLASVDICTKYLASSRQTRR